MYLQMLYRFLANFSEILLAKPGVKSDSCIIVGMFSERAAITTGTETNPPENNRVWFSLFNTLRASITPFKTLNTFSHYQLIDIDVIYH